MATKGKSLADFRASYDKSLIIPARIRAALAELGDGWEAEGEFVRRVGVAMADFGKYREPFLADHTVEVRARNKNTQRIWAGTKALAAQLRRVQESQ